MAKQQAFSPGGRPRNGGSIAGPGGGDPFGGAAGLPPGFMPSGPGAGITLPPYGSSWGSPTVRSASGGPPAVRKIYEICASADGLTDAARCMPHSCACCCHEYVKLEECQVEMSDLDDLNWACNVDGELSRVNTHYREADQAGAESVAGSCLSFHGWPRDLP